MDGQISPITKGLDCTQRCIPSWHGMALRIGVLLQRGRQAVRRPLQTGGVSVTSLLPEELDLVRGLLDNCLRRLAQGAVLGLPGVEGLAHGIPAGRANADAPAIEERQHLLAQARRCGGGGFPATGTPRGARRGSGFLSGSSAAAFALALLLPLYLTHPHARTRRWHLVACRADPRPGTAVLGLRHLGLLGVPFFGRLEEGVHFCLAEDVGLPLPLHSVSETNLPRR